MLGAKCYAQTDFQKQSGPLDQKRVHLEGV